MSKAVSLAGYFTVNEKACKQAHMAHQVWDRDSLIKSLEYVTDKN